MQKSLIKLQTNGQKTNRQTEFLKLCIIGVIKGDLGSITALRAGNRKKTLSVPEQRDISVFQKKFLEFLADDRRRRSWLSSASWSRRSFQGLPNHCLKKNTLINQEEDKFLVIYFLSGSRRHVSLTIC